MTPNTPNIADPVVEDPVVEDPVVGVKPEHHY
jgi:hypothetical protein